MLCCYWDSRSFCIGSCQVTYLYLLYQTAKTKVINSCLNPVWNEELSFSLMDPVGVLYLVSFNFPYLLYLL